MQYVLAWALKCHLGRKESGWRSRRCHFPRSAHKVRAHYPENQEQSHLFVRTIRRWKPGKRAERRRCVCNSKHAHVSFARAEKQVPWEVLALWSSQQQGSANHFVNRLSCFQQKEFVQTSELVWLFTCLRLQQNYVKRVLGLYVKRSKPYFSCRYHI